MRTMSLLAASAAVLLAAAPARAADAAAPVYLPPNTPVTLTLNETLSSRHARRGQVVRLSVAEDVRADERIVIPRGTAAWGRVTAKTGRAILGKSGKLALALEGVGVDGRWLPLDGEVRTEGDGGTAKVLLGGLIFAPLGVIVTGRSAVWEQGATFTAFTAEPVQRPAALAASALDCRC